MWKVERRETKCMGFMKTNFRLWRIVDRDWAIGLGSNLKGLDILLHKVQIFMHWGTSGVWELTNRHWNTIENWRKEKQFGSRGCPLEKWGRKQTWAGRGWRKGQGESIGEPFIYESEPWRDRLDGYLTEPPEGKSEEEEVLEEAMVWAGPPHGEIWWAPGQGYCSES